MFLDEMKRRVRNAVATTGAGGEIQPFDVARIAPQAMPHASQWAGTGPAHLVVPDHAPHEPQAQVSQCRTSHPDYRVEEKGVRHGVTFKLRVRLRISASPGVLNRRAPAPRRQILLSGGSKPAGLKPRPTVRKNHSISRIQSIPG